MTLLAADMGGTKSNLWLFERKDGRREIHDAAGDSRVRRYASDMI